ncbi:hypothetical protein DUI87_03977 [Hirundo rustica rustica]|uniref:ribonuclease H n=1 Tax=Hirundo rustica rustica TaxID=333673 RepID=A0A3M0LJT0_HIRRU|nr:hypothetical protein DUI87_03977 [Hirundo rustica rustica]
MALADADEQCKAAILGLSTEPASTLHDMLQIPLHPDDAPHFAFLVPTLNQEAPRKRYHWKFLPQGMKNSPSVCQWYLSSLLSPVRAAVGEANILHYMDDVLMCAPNDDLLSHMLDLTIDSLVAAVVKLQEEKIQRMPPWKYLGLEIGKRTIVPQKLVVKNNTKTLADVQQLCGSLNWVRPWLGLTTEDLDPLFNLLKGEEEISSPRTLTQEARAALEKVQDCMATRQANRCKSDLPFKFIILGKLPHLHGMIFQWERVEKSKKDKDYKLYVENLNPPVVHRFRENCQLQLKAKPPVMVKDPAAWETEGPHDLITWGRGHAYESTPSGLKWVPAKLFGKEYIQDEDYFFSKPEYFLLFVGESHSKSPVFKLICAKQSNEWLLVTENSEETGTASTQTVTEKKGTKNKATVSVSTPAVTEEKETKAAISISTQIVTEAEQPKPVAVAPIQKKSKSKSIRIVTDEDVAGPSQPAEETEPEIITRSLSLGELRDLRREFTRQTNESILTWLLRIWDAAANDTILDGSEAK